MISLPIYSMYNPRLQNDCRMLDSSTYTAELITSINASVTKYNKKWNKYAQTYGYSLKDGERFVGQYDYERYVDIWDDVNGN